MYYNGKWLIILFSMTEWNWETVHPRPLDQFGRLREEVPSSVTFWWIIDHLVAVLKIFSLKKVILVDFPLKVEWYTAQTYISYEFGGHAIAYLFKSLHKPIYDGCRSSLVEKKCPKCPQSSRKLHRQKFKCFSLTWVEKVYLFYVTLVLTLFVSLLINLSYRITIRFKCKHGHLIILSHNLCNSCKMHGYYLIIMCCIL